MSRMSRFVEVPGGRIWAVDEGVGPPIVLVHAAIVDLDAWDLVVPPLLRAGYRVIRYDMRGYGRSSPASGPLCRRDDLDLVLNALEVTRAHLVGCSNGGQICLDLALEQPQRVASLTLVGATPSGFEPSMASPAAEVVWESAPSKVLPGTPNRSRCTWCDTPLPGLETWRPKCSPTVMRKI